MNQAERKFSSPNGSALHALNIKRFLNFQSSHIFAFSSSDVRTSPTQSPQKMKCFLSFEHGREVNTKVTHCECNFQTISEIGIILIAVMDAVVVERKYSIVYQLDAQHNFLISSNRRTTHKGV